MPKITGGRGKRAPYVSTHARIPEPLKPFVEIMANAFRQAVEELPENEGLRFNYSEFIEPQKKAVNALSEFMDCPVETKELPVVDYLTEVDKAVEIAKRIIKKKKSAKVSLEAFINELYSVDISLDS